MGNNLHMVKTKWQKALSKTLDEFSGSVQAHCYQLCQDWGVKPQHQLHQLRDPQLPQTDSKKTLYQQLIQRLSRPHYRSIADCLPFSHKPQMLLEMQSTPVEGSDEKLKSLSGPIRSCV